MRIILLHKKKMMESLLSSDESINAVAERFGLELDTTNKQVAAYVTASVVLNGFFDILSGTADAASVVSSLNLQAFSINQIKQITQKINMNVMKLMESDAKTAINYFERKKYQEANDLAMRGFNAAPAGEEGLPIRLICTRIKLWTELILLERQQQNHKVLMSMAGETVKRNLDELLKEPDVRSLWKKKIVEIGKGRKDLLDEVSFLIGGFYSGMSSCLCWTHPDLKAENGDLAIIHTKYLPTGEKNFITVPISKHKETMTSIKIYKQHNELRITVIFIENNVPKEFELAPVVINLKPHKSSVWILKVQNKKYFLEESHSSEFLLDPGYTDFSDCEDEVDEMDEVDEVGEVIKLN